MKQTLTIFFYALLFSFPCAAADEVQAEHISAKLLSAYEGTGNRPQVDMGLAVALEPEWYTYWRMPGDNGLAPAFNWKDSVNVKEVIVSYPAPKRFTTFDMHSFGYKDEFLLPLSVVPEVAGKPLTLNLEMNVVICHEICVPATLAVSKTVDGDGNKRTADFALLKRARESLPLKENTKSLGMDAAVLAKDAIVVTVFSKNGFDGMDLVMETQGTLITAAPEILPDADDKTKAILKIKAPEGFDFAKALFGKTATMTLIQGDHAVEKNFTF